MADFGSDVNGVAGSRLTCSQSISEGGQVTPLAAGPGQQGLGLREQEGTGGKPHLPSSFFFEGILQTLAQTGAQEESEQIKRNGRRYSEKTTITKKKAHTTC